MIVAHRGASDDAPENTLAAFELAWRQGADAIEADFRLTQDEQIVCIHDPTTARTAVRKLVVEDSTLTELRGLEYGRWKGTAWDGEPLPTLGDVLQTVPDHKTMVIEVKCGPEILPCLLDHLRAIERPIGLMVISYNEQVVRRCKQEIPSLRVHWLTRFDHGETAEYISSNVQRLGVDGVGMHNRCEIIDEPFVQELRGGGCQEFHVWTVDSIAEAERYRRLGAIAITTNVPAIVGPALRERTLRKSV